MIGDIWSQLRMRRGVRYGITKNNFVFYLFILFFFLTDGTIPACKKEAMNETFALTNIAPQVGVGFNRNCTCLFLCYLF
jgi:hypothetical protein